MTPIYASPTFACERHAWDDGSTLLVLSGDLDHFSAPRFQDAAGSALQTGCRRLTIDLGRVEYMDSAGLATLLVLYRRCIASECELALQDETGRQENLYALTGLDGVLPLRTPVQGATCP